MATTVGITVSGLEPIREKLMGLESRMADFSPALRLIARLLELQTIRVFETQGQFIGAAWTPLAASTVQARARRWGYYRQPSSVGGPAWPIMIWSGRLLSGFEEGSPDHVQEITPTSLRWGNRVPYARYLQRRLPMVAFTNSFRERDLVLTPLRLWVQGVPAGAIETVARARAGL